MQQLLPANVIVNRFAVLLGAVCAVEAALCFLVAKPQVWCAILPLAIPTLLPSLIYVRRERQQKAV